MARVRFLGGTSTGAIRIGNNAGLVDAETIDIGPLPLPATGKRYEWDNNVSVIAPNVLVTIGASATLSAINLRNAINAFPPVPGVVASIDPKDPAVVRIDAIANGSPGNLVMAETMVDVLNIISGAAMTDGESALNQVAYRGKHVVTALDVAATNIMIPTGATTPRFKQVEVYTAAGVKVAVTSQVTFAAGVLRVDFAGGVNPALNDEVNWLIWE